MPFQEPTLSRSLRISALALGVFIALVPSHAQAKRPAPTPTPTATPSPPPEDPAITAIARREFVAWQAGVVNPNHYAAQSQGGLAADRVTTISKQLGTLGVLQKTEWVEPVVVDDMPTVKGYIYKMTCSNGVVYERLIMGADGKVDGVVFMDKLPQ